MEPRELLALLEEVRKGRVDPAKLLRYVPDPPRLAPTLNRLIDRVMHPLAEKRTELYVVDSALHILVEVGDQLVQSIAKTVRFNIPRVLEKAGVGEGEREGRGKIG